ncbi:hypothetical protein EW145_g7272 [Phellinidium pouzarii]|uniref:NodB homology domain-containing protein n=1 Tax=Phellinidium pouzarii TaxID=167371 RepID=A0A4S4KMB4_9AGAM|nr:hypothetical protein EW145_g7272 [Phellinidium pouzarii]
MPRQILVGFGVDVDAVAGWLGSYGGQDSPGDISRGMYAGEVGTPRLLKLFEKYKIKTTWFIPGHSLETFPEQMAAVRDAGHEIGLHGYSHENPIEMSEEQQTDILNHTFDLFTKFNNGVPPKGSVAPWWETSKEGTNLLLDKGIEYDHSNMAHEFIKSSANSHGWVNTRDVEDLWKDTFSYCYREEEDFIFPITIHPDVSGRPHVLLMLERFIEWVNTHEHVQWVPMIAMARAFRAKKQPAAGPSSFNEFTIWDLAKAKKQSTRRAASDVRVVSEARAACLHLHSTFQFTTGLETNISSIMSIMSYNGGSVVAMVGKECVAIASDLRLGNQSFTIACNHEKVFPITDRIYLGLAGLATDVATLHDRFRYRVNMYTIKEEREIAPETFARLVSSTLYERRFSPYYVEPVIAGIGTSPTGKTEPFIAAADLIGCLNFARDFVVSGTASEKLFGVAEGLWEPDLEPEDLFETISQTLMNAVDRDAFSGWGAVVHVITKDKVVTRTLKGRMD